MEKRNSSKLHPSQLPINLIVFDQINPFSGKILWAESCQSTMDLAYEQVQQHMMNSGDLLLTGFQSLGRGRHPQKTWISQPRTGFLSTFVLTSAQIQEPLSLRVGLSVCRLIEETFGLPTQLKWPNDVLIYGKKVAGILIEQRSELILIGLGINLLGTVHDLGTTIEDSITTFLTRNPEEGELIRMSDQWKSIQKNYLLGVTDLAHSYLSLLGQTMGDPDWRRSVRFRLAYKNDLVELGDSQASSAYGHGVKGFLRDIDRDGGVLIDLESGSQLKVTSGSLKPV
jgi:biotin-[acetyl-CoA-carboxylase] ligase BirA-like protein